MASKVCTEQKELTNLTGSEKNCILNIPHWPSFGLGGPSQLVNPRLRDLPGTVSCKRAVVGSI